MLPSWLTGFSKNGHLNGCICRQCKKNPLDDVLELEDRMLALRDSHVTLQEFALELNGSIDDVFDQVYDNLDPEVAYNVIALGLEEEFASAQRQCNRHYARERVWGVESIYAATMSRIIERYRQLANERLAKRFPHGKG